MAQTLLRLGRWRIEGRVPDTGRYVLIAAPHTSNWDFLWTMSTAIALGVKINWMAKHTIFKPVIGPLFKRWGGLPIQRDKSINRVAAIAEQLAKAKSMVVLVPPEGTRSYAEYWRSGFYHIARTAKVPIVPGFLDYGKRRVGFGPIIPVTGDMRLDMDRLRAFYADKIGKFPEKMGPIRLREEDMVESVGGL